MPTERENPFVGPRALEVADGIYGRDEELRELLWFFTAERIVWLHSPSGAGKTSLLQAGLIPKLEADDFEVLPTIRVNRETGAGGNRYEASMLSCLGTASSFERTGGGLTDYLKVGAGGKSRVLIFDQFEEILTLDSTDVEAKKAFFETLGRALQLRDIWGLFVIREDFLPALDPFVRAIPTQMNHRFRLDLLSVGNAEEAMKQIARRGGRKFSREAAGILGAELAKVRVQSAGGEQWKTGRVVEPVMLQVVCRSMWEEIPAGDRTIEPRHVPTGDMVAKSLANYYATGVKSVSGTIAGERAVRTWFGEKLIVSGIRNQVLDASGDGAALGTALAAALVKTHLIRREDRGDRIWYELAHDRLVEPVREDNQRWAEENLHWVERRADLWRLQNKPKTILLAGEELRKAELWIKDSRPELTALENEFLTQSREEQKVRDRIRWWTRFAWVAAGVTFAFFMFAMFLYQGARLGELVNRAYLQVRTSGGMPGCAVRDGLDALDIADNLRPDLRRTAMEALSEVLQGSGPAYEVSRSEARLAFSPDVRLLAIASGDQVNLYRAPDAHIQYRWKLSNNVCTITRVALSRDGKHIAFGLTNGQTVGGTVQAGGGETELPCTTAPPDSAAVEALAFSGNGVLASGSPNGILIDGRLISQVDATALVFRPDGEVLAAGLRDGTVRILDRNGKQMNKLAHGDQPVTGIAWGPNALAAVSRGSGALRVWDDRGNLRVSEVAHPAGIAGVALSPDGSMLATLGLGEDHQTRIRLLASDAASLILRTPPANEASLSDVLFLDRTHLLVADSSGGVRLFPLDARSIRERALNFLRDHACAKPSYAATGSRGPTIQ